MTRKPGPMAFSLKRFPINTSLYPLPCPRVHSSAGEWYHRSDTVSVVLKGEENIRDMGRLNNLHEELVIGILLCLPVDSLMRFKCVHKSWYDLIKSPQFLTTRSASSVDNDSSNLCILVKNSNTNARRTDEKVTTLSLVTCDKVHHETPYGNGVSFSVKDVDLPLVGKCPDIFVTANSHGIVCLYVRYCKYMALVNPGIRESMSIPAKSCIPLPRIDDDICIHEVCRVGSGFDPKNNDFKIVRIIHILMSSGTPIGYPRAELYTLSSNSWRQIDFVPYCDITPTLAYNYLEIYWNGVYYWPLEAEYYQEHYVPRGILSFDISDEVFQFRLLPKWIFEFDDDEDLRTMVDFGMLEYNGTLALVSYARIDMETCFYIWALDEFWVNGALTKLLSIGPLLQVEQPLGFLKSDQLLLQLFDGEVQSYNMITKERKNLPIYCQGFRDQVVFYRPTLISIQGGGNN